MTGSWPVGNLLIGAVALAVRDINSDPEILRGKRLEYVWGDDGCDRSKSVAEFFDMLDRSGPIDALIGPGCSRGCEATATLTQARNIPQISATCAAATLSNKDEFPFFVRTTSPYTKWAPAIVALMQWAAWTRLSIVGDTAMASAAAALRAVAAKSGFQLGTDLQFNEGHLLDAPGQSSPLLSILGVGVRVVAVFAFGSDYRAIAVEAQKHGMSHGWVWMGIDMVFGSEQGTTGTELSLAQAALHGWIYFEPSNAANRTFFDRVKAASIADFGQHLGDAESTSLYAANLYDAITLFAVAASKHIGDLNGKLIVDAMRNASFDGMTGRVLLDESGDMKESIRTMNYVLEADGIMRGRRMGTYSGLNREYSAAPYAVIWPGGSSAMPVAWLSCEIGSYLVQQSLCEPCPAGSRSVGGTVTSCQQCSAGLRSCRAHGLAV